MADWSRCEIPERDPDYVSYSGSAYWNFGKKVRRLSDHWGTVASCKWLLEGNHIQSFLCGECHYDDFRSISSVYKDDAMLESPYSLEELADKFKSFSKNEQNEDKCKPLPPLTKDESVGYMWKLLDIASEMPLNKQQCFLFGQLLCQYEMAIIAESLGKKGRFYVIPEDKIKEITG